MLAGARGGVPLTRLRLHDILLWCGVVPGAEAEAAEMGSGVLERSLGDA